jgi:hypothetical protein
VIYFEDLGKLYVSYEPVMFGVKTSTAGSLYYKIYFYFADLRKSSTESDGLVSSTVSSESSDSSLEDLKNSLKVVFYQLRSCYLNPYLEYLFRDQVTKLLPSSDVDEILKRRVS